WSGKINQLWPLLGISNQLLACIALCAATSMLINQKKARYTWVTLIPLGFVGVATESAGYQLIRGKFLLDAHKDSIGYLLAVLCALAMAALICISADSLTKWVKTARSSSCN